ncbi:GumC family protein [Granulicella mallensis]|uniref:Lipopolysaccharide biosynthesis protein n=1 Tax=Granulicella mallensis (strain ATCC BAA-1857 / DSM 23137 / MP5ACTX8) TaxID=682795 RepID=G8NZN3_GRAMM|nr:GNVR domain-containing protein [Granulicella mallensis]AEU39153.1 lipopolysaccharide biosynthesis protein [Granulicella mallensis MP5ACTX8]
MTFSNFIDILWQNRKAILLSGASVFVLATILAFVLPFTYTASATFLPPGTNTGGSSAIAMMGQLSALGGGGGASSLLGGKSQADLFVGLLKSHSVSHALIQRFDLKKVYKVKKESDAAKALTAHSNFEADSKSSIIQIEVTDKSPQRASDLANGYLEALQDASANLALTESSQRRLFYEQRLAKERDDLANAEVELKQDQEKSGLIAPAGQTASELQTLAQLRSQVSEREVRLASLQYYESEDNPDVLRLRQEIASLKEHVAQLENGQNKGQFGSFSTAQVPEMQLEYIRKARDVKYHEVLFESIAKQYEAARLDEAKDTPLQIIDKATVPDTKSGPHRGIIMLIGLILGLMAGTVWVLFRVAQQQAR